VLVEFCLNLACPCFAYGLLVLRIYSCLLGIALTFALSGAPATSALAAAAALPSKPGAHHPKATGCGPERLGTSRTIVLDAAKHRYLTGKEPALGLRDKEVILTFDDGPIAGKTTRILKSLKHECVKATFFYVGKMARAYPKLVRKVINQGHTLAHHTHDHNRLPSYSTTKASLLIDKGVSRLQKIAYGDDSSTPRTPFFRYPYLARTNRTDKILAKKGMIAFGANIDALDWKQNSPAKVHDRIMRRLRKQGRGIILMHDIQGRTAKMLPRLLRSLNDEGYRVVHIVAKGQARPEEKPVVVAALESDANNAPITKVAKAPVKLGTSKERISEKLSAQIKSRLQFPEPPMLNEPALKTAKQDRYVYRADPMESRLKPAKKKPSVKAVKRRKRYKVARAKLRTGFQLATAKRHKTVKMGSWKLRRSQWILR